MKTRLKTAHEEDYISGDIKKTFGILFNYSISTNIDNTADIERMDSYVYVFNPKTARYTFFNTIIDMINSQLYGDEKIKRAYMDEWEFDEYYDAPFIEGTFGEKLNWI